MTLSLLKIQIRSFLSRSLALDRMILFLPEGSLKARLETLWTETLAKPISNQEGETRPQLL